MAEQNKLRKLWSNSKAKTKQMQFAECKCKEQTTYIYKNINNKSLNKKSRNAKIK